MKKKSIILLSLMAALPFTVASCHHEQPVDSSSSEISSQTVEVRLDLSASEIALKAYDTYQLSCMAAMKPSIGSAKIQALLPWTKTV